MTGEVSQSNLPWQEDPNCGAADYVAGRKELPSIAGAIASAAEYGFAGLIDVVAAEAAARLPIEGEGGTANEAAALKQFSDVRTDDL